MCDVEVDSVAPVLGRFTLRGELLAGKQPGFSMSSSASPTALAIDNLYARDFVGYYFIYIQPKLIFQEEPAMVLTVIAKIEARHDAADKVRARICNLVEPTRREKGCVEYSLYQDNDNPSVFIFYENWESQADLDAHMKSPHFKECFAAIEGLFDIEVHLLSKVL